jgi:hypothetical protein
MNFADPIRYSTPGAPLLIANAADARHWQGGESDGSGVVVEYWGEGIEKLPKEFSAPVKKNGDGAVKFATPAEAAQFEQELLRHFKKLHPKAAKPPEYPDYPVYYIGEERIFGIERKFNSALDAAVKKLKGDVAVIVFDKKQKAQGLFFQIEGDGSGIIAADESSKVIVVANVSTADTDDFSGLASALGKTVLKRLKAKGKIRLDAEVVIFDAGQSAAQVATRNWKTDDLTAGVTRALKSKQQAPIAIAGQKMAAGACLRVAPGTYEYAIVHDARAPKLVYDAVWLWTS